MTKQSQLVFYRFLVQFVINRVLTSNLTLAGFSGAGLGRSEPETTLEIFLGLDGVGAFSFVNLDLRACSTSGAESSLDADESVLRLLVNNDFLVATSMSHFLSCVCQ